MLVFFVGELIAIHGRQIENDSTERNGKRECRAEANAVPLQLFVFSFFPFHRRTIEIAPTPHRPDALVKIHICCR